MVSADALSPRCFSVQHGLVPPKRSTFPGWTDSIQASRLLASLSSCLERRGEETEDEERLPTTCCWLVGWLIISVVRCKQGSSSTPLLPRNSNQPDPAGTESARAPRPSTRPPTAPACPSTTTPGSPRTTPSPSPAPSPPPPARLSSRKPTRRTPSPPSSRMVLGA